MDCFFLYIFYQSRQASPFVTIMLHRYRDIYMITIAARFMTFDRHTHTHAHCTYAHRSVTTKIFFLLYFTISSSNSWTLNSIFIEWIALTHSKIEVKNFYFSFYSCNCTNFSCECVVVVDKKKIKAENTKWTKKQRKKNRKRNQN